jgi:predicted enzyme related to lactoylglutathione lyase
MAKITGIGGVFFKSRDPAALAKWYGDNLGLAIQDWGGAQIPTADGPPVSVWAPFSSDSDYFAPSSAPFMINFAVDDMDGFVAMLASKGIAVLKREEMAGLGSFAWIVDPEGNKVEFWQPEPAAPGS